MTTRNWVFLSAVVVALSFTGAAAAQDAQNGGTGQSQQEVYGGGGGTGNGDVQLHDEQANMEDGHAAHTPGATQHRDDTDPYEDPHESYYYLGVFYRHFIAPTYALNFYSPVVADQLRTGRKTATIRLGDKTGKYRKGMVVPVLVGQRFGPRERVFDAVIDKVEVKPLADVSPREIQHENAELRHLDEFVEFLRRLYNREVREDDVVTVIHFSEIRG